MSGVGDLNGDGLDEFIVGASLVDFPGDLGAAGELSWHLEFPAKVFGSPGWLQAAQFGLKTNVTGAIPFRGKTVGPDSSGTPAAAAQTSRLARVTMFRRVEGGEQGGLFSRGFEAGVCPTAPPW